MWHRHTFLRIIQWETALNERKVKNSPFASPLLNRSADGTYFLQVAQQIWGDSEKQPLLVFVLLRAGYSLITLLASSFADSVGGSDMLPQHHRLTVWVGLACLGFHALFECAGMAVDLWAGAAERDRDGEPLVGFSYGYQRLQVLSVFGSTVFLIFVSLFTLEHAVERFFEPSPISGGLVTAVALVGCIINLLGLLISQSFRGSGKSHGRETQCCKLTFSKTAKRPFRASCSGFV